MPPNACGGGAINASDVAVVGYPAQAPVADDKWFSQVSSPSDVIAACPPVGAIVAKKDASGKAYSVSVRQELCVACGRCRDTTDAMAYDPPGGRGVMVLVGGKASNSGRAGGQLMSKIVVPYLQRAAPLADPREGGEEDSGHVGGKRGEGGERMGGTGWPGLGGTGSTS